MKKMYLLKYVFRVFFIALTLTTHTYAEPTIEETIDYILKKYKGDCYTERRSWRIEYISAIVVANGRLVVSKRRITTHSGIMAPLGSREEDGTLTVTLEDLDPRVSSERLGDTNADSNCILVNIECSKAECIVESGTQFATVGASSDFSKEEKQYRLVKDKWEFIMGGDMKNAKRITKALSHLIKLSGGKEQLF